MDFERDSVHGPDITIGLAQVIDCNDLHSPLSRLATEKAILAEMPSKFDARLKTRWKEPPPQLTFKNDPSKMEWILSPLRLPDKVTEKQGPSEP
jgi:hypothetical protein